MSRPFALFCTLSILISGFSGGASMNQTDSPNAAANGQEARRTAKLLHEAYVETLFVVHREYFDEDERDTLPARAFEEVFKNVDRKTGVTSNWISVNAPAMNVDHEPSNAFEKEAARALTNGASEFERQDGSMFRRAAPVKFLASCNKCHLSALGSRKAGRMAGLVVSLPLAKASTVNPSSR